MTRVCIHTAIFGGYTPLREPAEPDPSVSMIVHSDQWLESLTWKCSWVRDVTDSEPRERAKFHKLRPPVGFDYTIWVDSTFQLGNARRFADFCISALGDKDLGLFRHPERTNIYEECEASLTHHVNKYANTRVAEQVAWYRRCGLPDDHGLWAGGIVVRRSPSMRVECFNTRWEHEILTWSQQDQLSLPYVFWLLGWQPATIPGNVYEGTDHKWNRGPDR